MARTELTVQEFDVDGLDESLESANADGEYFSNDGGVFLYVKNGSGSPITLTAQTPAEIGGLDIEEKTYVIGAGENGFWGFFNPAMFNQSNGTVYIDFSDVTSLTIGAFKPL